MKNAINTINKLIWKLRIITIDIMIAMKGV